MTHLAGFKCGVNYPPLLHAFGTHARANMILKNHCQLARLARSRLPIIYEWPGAVYCCFKSETVMDQIVYGHRSESETE